jgi:hypothetical protein
MSNKIASRIWQQAVSMMLSITFTTRVQLLFAL